MATSLVTLNSEMFDCAVCLTNMMPRHPRALICLHTFCEECLQGIQRGAPRKDIIVCPTCRRETRLPNSDVKCLTENFHLKTIYEAYARSGGSLEEANPPIRPQRQNRKIASCFPNNPETWSMTEDRQLAEALEASMKLGPKTYKGKTLAAQGRVKPLVYNFDDSKMIEGGARLAGMRLWIRTWDDRPVLGGIQILYEKRRSSEVHGDTFGAKEEFTLRNGEAITHISFRHGWLVDSLCFYTNFGRQLGPYGGAGGSPGQEDLGKKYGDVQLAFLSGSVVNTQGSLAITNLTFHWFRTAEQRGVPMMQGPVYLKGTTLANQGRVGPVSYNFNDQEKAHRWGMIKGIKLWIRRWDDRPVIGGVQIIYSGQHTEVHGGTVGTKQEFQLQSGETITHISYRHGWLVDSLCFHTSLENTYGAYGGPGGGPGHEDLRLRHSDIYLAYLSGSIVSTQGSLAITNLSFHWAYLSDR